MRTLKRAVESGRVAHAYLFSGPRGTGKTSTAKVLAMGLNCVKGPTAEPDGTCGSCRAIVNNSSMDVLEMDAASNRGIDEIRDLRDKVNLAPAAARTKVYIIDEVHMLTTEAFNALLKMLEEPPGHVVFVLATTEKHRVPATIVSRCQSFDFRRPSVTLLSEKLREIADAEGIEAEPEALTILAREGRGSFRDAEGLLDQLASFADGPVTARKVRELLGSVGSDVLLEATDALHERRSADALRLLDRLSNEGKDLSQFAGELIAHLRRLMLLPDAPEVALAEVGAEERAGLKEQAHRVHVAETVRMISSLGDALSRMRRGGDAKLELELTFLKLARDYEEPSVERLLERLEALERAVADGAVVASNAGRHELENREEPGRGSKAPITQAPDAEATDAEASAPGDRAGGAGREEEGRAGDEPEAEENGAFAAIEGRWAEVLRGLKNRKKALTAAYLEEGRARPIGLESQILTVELSGEQGAFVKDVDKPQHKEALGEVLEECFGIRPRVEFRIGGETGGVGAGGAVRTTAGAPPASPRGISGAATPRVDPGPRDDLTEPGSSDGPGPQPGPAMVARYEAPQEGSSGAEGAEGDDGTIQSPQEALEMAWDLFGGPGEKSPGGNQNGGV